MILVISFKRKVTLELRGMSLACILLIYTYKGSLLLSGYNHVLAESETNLFCKFASSVESDQLTSSEASWSGSTLFAIQAMNLQRNMRVESDTFLLIIEKRYCWVFAGN